MTNSDIIAIVAIVISGFISVATLIASFYTNRANNRAKLQEIAFDKRLEALREMYKKMSELNAEFEFASYVRMLTNE